MKQGFIKLYRTILDSDLLYIEGLWTMYTYILLKAKHVDSSFPISTGKGRFIIKVPKGAFVTGRKSLARDLKIPPSTARNRLRTLEKMGYVDIKKDSQYSIVYIRDRSVFPKNEDRQEDNERTTKGQRKDTYKNVKECIRTNIYSDNETLREYFASISSLYSNNEQRLIASFLDYWTEKSPQGKKEKWQMEKTFDAKLRFKKWIANNKKWFKDDIGEGRLPR